MERCIEYIEETLHVPVDASVYQHCDKLPLYLRNGYDLYLLTIQGVECLLMRPKEPANLSSLRKQCGLLSKLTGLDCVVSLENVRVYTREKMLSEGIPFVVAGQQLYMPFMGVALTKKAIRDIPQAQQLSYGAQKMLLNAIYQGWRTITLTETAKALKISKMSVTRYFDELQSLGISLIKSGKKERRFLWDADRRALWEYVHPFLRNPIAKQHRLEYLTDSTPAKLGGISALCHYSMLADNSYTTYAISKETAKAIGLSTFKQIPSDEVPGAVVQVMHYDVEYGDANAIDPLTAILSLADDDKTDPRVEAAIEQTLEDCLHD